MTSGSGEAGILSPAGMVGRLSVNGLMMETGSPDIQYTGESSSMISTGRDEKTRK
ncbi:MAG: hypothetical protein BWY05_01193 [Euryarchaeota archaeon ADurb.Bin165]|nr:MAG: hypothetical protein BWY05_01193 [Euryarchaeota archaeon ADurb.Bin165]